MAKSPLVSELAKEMKITQAIMLNGWPHKDISDLAVMTMVSIYHELGLCEPKMKVDHRWYLAGRIAARIKKDLVT